MSFRTSYKVLRETAGTYTNGVWVRGTRTVTTCLASVQPIDLKSETGMHPKPDGRHLMDTVKIYTSMALNVTADGEGVQPDIIVFDGYGYELNDRGAYRSGVINHYKYTAKKVFKFTNDTAWTNGTLARP
jgi:hypothetical protein